MRPSPIGAMGVIGETAHVSLPAGPSLPLDGLHRLSGSVNRAESLEQIYDAAIAALLESLGADRASILLYDQEMVMRFVAWHGLSEGYRRAVEGHSPWTPETVDPEPILVDDVDLDDELAPYRPTIRGEGIRALAFIPLLYRTRLLGKFMVYFDQPHPFSDQEKMLAQTIANHVAFAIEQKRTEQNLRLYRKIFENSPTGIGVVGLDGRYIEQNEAHRRLIGYSSEELKGATPAIHLGQEAFERIAASLTEGDLFVDEFVSTTKDGRKLAIDLSAFLVRDEQGNPVCLVGMKQDITPRKEAERQIRRINQELEERVARRTAELKRANDEMEGFCYSVSHDLRAPLRGISGASNMLLEDYGEKLDEEARTHLRRLSAASTRMAQLIDDLLQYSRLGRKEVEREPVNLTHLASQAAEEIRSRTEHAAELRLHPTEEVHADARLMEIVVHNLLENAFKFTNGRPGGLVEFGYEDGAFYVRDNGVGFDPKYAAKLFQPFERLHTEAEYPGTGIGLANVKRIVERHGGQVWYESSLGAGSTFYFSLS